MTYDGLSPALKAEINERDGGRCRWCGATNQGVDHHHIRYRRGYADDVLENLISLCRRHHNFVHGIPLPGSGKTIVKADAQLVLSELVRTPGQTGAALWRQKLAGHEVVVDNLQAWREAHLREFPSHFAWLNFGAIAETDAGCSDCPAVPQDVAPDVCPECGNDEPCEGYRFCSDCLELVG